MKKTQIVILCLLSTKKYKNLFLCGLLLTAGLAPLASEVMFTPRAQHNTKGVQAVTDAWNAVAQAHPDSAAAILAKNPGEPGYAGYIYVDFNDAKLRFSGAHSLFDTNLFQIVLPSRPSEPDLSRAIAHEASHAYFANQVPYFGVDRVLPPRYAVGMFMISEIAAFLEQAKVEISTRHYDGDIPENISERPEMGEDISLYFHQLHKYIANTNPDLDENAVWQRACNEFALGFLANDVYMHDSINTLQPEVYMLKDAKGKAVSNIQARGTYYTPPVLNSRSSQYTANLDVIMRRYLQEAMPAGVPFTVDVNAWLAELLRNIDRIDSERAAKGKTTCSQVDALMANSMKQVDALGDRALDGDMSIGAKSLAWLDALVGAAGQNP